MIGLQLLAGMLAALERLKSSDGKGKVLSTSEAHRLGGFARKKKLSRKALSAIGRKGAGQARAKKLTPTRRRKIAQKAGRVSAQRKKDRAGGLGSVSATPAS